MKKVHLLLLIFFITFSINAQVGESYYVNTSTLNVRSQPSSSSEILKKLTKYDNVILISDSIQNLEWVNVRIEEIQGFVSKDYLRKGKVYINTYNVRTGAKCNDGSNSSATGRGACSHHGGVAYWITRTEKSIEVTDN